VRTAEVEMMPRYGNDREVEDIIMPPKVGKQVSNEIPDQFAYLLD